MQPKTTKNKFGQTMQAETEVSQLTYKQLQAVVKEMKCLMSCYKDVKLNAKREVLEQVVIEASTRNGQGYRDVAQAVNMTSLTEEEKCQVTKASRQVYTAAIEASIATSTKEVTVVDVLANADEMVENEVYNSKRNIITRYQGKVSECKGEVALGRGWTTCLAPACSLASKPKIEVELYTEAMSAEDDELIAGVKVDDVEPQSNNQEAKTYRNRWNELHPEDPCYIDAYADTNNLPLELRYDHPLDGRVSPLCCYLEDKFKTDNYGSFHAISWYSQVYCFGQKCDIADEPVASHDLSNLADIPEDDTPWCVVCESENCKHLVESVEGVPTGDHYPGQAVYPDWDESYTYESYLNSYCELACVWDAPVDPLDLEYVEPCDRLIVTNLTFEIDGKVDLLQRVTFTAAIANVNRVFDKAASKGYDLVLYIGSRHHFDRAHYDWWKVEGMSILSTAKPNIEYKSLVTVTEPDANSSDRYQNADVLVANITYHGGDDAGRPMLHYYDKRDPVELLRSGIHQDRFTSTFSEVHGVACSLEDNLDLAAYEASKHKETIILTEAEFNQVCEEHGFTRTDTSMMWADIRQALLQDADFKSAYDATPDLRTDF